MTDCISRDQLADLLSVLDHPATVTLDHLTSCPSCRDELAALEQVRGLLRTDQPVPTEFVDSVMQRIEVAGARIPDAGEVQPYVSEPVVEQQSRWIAGVQAAGRRGFAAVSSGLAVAVVLIAASNSAPAGIDYSPVALLAGILFGCGLAVHEFLRDQTRQA